MAEETLMREAKKLRIRVRDYLEEERSFMKSLNLFLDKIEELDNKVHKADVIPEREEMYKLHIGVYEALSDVLNKLSKVDHERSHMPESLGTLLTSMEKEFLKVLCC